VFKKKDNGKQKDSATLETLLRKRETIPEWSKKEHLTKVSGVSGNPEPLSRFEFLSYFFMI